MRALSLTLVALALASCGGPDEPPDRGAGSDLAGLPLRAEELPEGLSLDEDAEGPIDSLREVLPTVAAAPQLPPLATAVRRSFLGGWKTVYSGGSAGGRISATSSVLRFADDGDADSFLDYLREAQTGEITLGSERKDVELLEAPGVGEEAYGWHQVVPGSETSGSSWRRGDLVLTITLGGPVGQASAGSALELARTVDSRLE